ncbi:MAG: 2-hydroxyacid dehydrogenase [Flavobacteriaceae bacterium]|nr:2-hydroxyacid dehydrogenase [Flavobacteriaceae bacterium]MDZ4146977.1 2-hydroxyacid dehydrogenase [Flavobacteriaceae bacterium]
MKILHLDTNHPLLIEQLTSLGFENHEDYKSTKQHIEKIISGYDGIIIRSRFPVDRTFIEAAKNLKFIGRVGAGLENIDIQAAKERNIQLITAAEGNRNAVGEHALGMLLALLNKLHTADREVRAGKWLREENRGVELDGQTIGIIGYGNTGKAFAKKLRGFEVTVLCHDILPNVGDENANQVGLAELKSKADVVSLHIPQTSETQWMVDKKWIESFKNSFWFINTARGKSVVTADLVAALQSGKIRGAALDVLEYEKSSFENLFTENELPEPLQYLIEAKNVLLTPHVAGWTVESHQKLAQTIVDKIRKLYRL